MELRISCAAEVNEPVEEMTAYEFVVGYAVKVTCFHPIIAVDAVIGALKLTAAAHIDPDTQIPVDDSPDLPVPVNFEKRILSVRFQQKSA